MNPEPSPIKNLPTIIIVMFLIKERTVPMMIKKWKKITTLLLPPWMAGPPNKQPKVTPAITSTFKRLKY